MKKILIVANHYITIYAYRKELVKKLVVENEVYIALPDDVNNKFFKDMGCKIINISVDRRGSNPITDSKLLINYIKIMKKIKPDIVLTYTIKPNIYGGIAARISGVRSIHTVTGLGSVYIQNMWQKHVVIILNSIAFRGAKKVVFLNKDNEKFYKECKIISKKQSTMIVPGSGVNLEEFKFCPINESNKLVFTFVGRVLKDKGIEEYLEAAKQIVSKYPESIFQIVGFVDEEKYIGLLKKYEEEGIISYLGKRNDIPNIMAESTCIVLPSYGEGRGTVLQEGAAIGRALITCDTYGCRENVVEGRNGFLCRVCDAKSLQESIEKFINLTAEEKIEMGKNSRKIAEEKFDRKLVIEKYIDTINIILNE